MSRTNGGQHQSPDSSGSGKVEQLHNITKLFMMIFGAYNFIAVMWLSLKVFNPDAWLPNLPPSTYVAIEIALFIFWVLQLGRIEGFSGAKEKKGTTTSR